MKFHRLVTHLKCIPRASTHPGNVLGKRRVPRCARKTCARTETQFIVTYLEVRGTQAARRSKNGLLDVSFFSLRFDVCFRRAKHRGGVYRAKLPKKRRKLDCLYYSPFAFDKYGCKCKTGSGSARPETRFIHIHPARARIGVTYLAKFLPSRQSHSINNERTYLAWMLSTYGTRAPRIHIDRTQMHALTHVFVRARRVRGVLRAVVFPREYLAKYFTHREIFTYYTPPRQGCIFISLVIITETRHIGVVESRY